MYKLQKAQYTAFLGWWIKEKGKNDLYLRQSLTVESSNGYATNNVGFWNTEKQANKARKRFLRKQRLNNIDWYQGQFEKGVEIVIQSNAKNWHLCKEIQPRNLRGIRDIKLASKVHTYEQ